MKTLLTAIVLVAALTALPAAAQSTIVVNVPFDFYAADKLLPAGEYTLAPLSDSKVNITLLRAVGSGKMVAVADHPRGNHAKRNEKTRVVFNKYPGEKYFLSQTWVEDEPLGRELIKTKRERQSVTSILLTGRKAETVTILASVR
ncbi:MAG: hypothetical protein IPM24_04295 [Bryobacterales bacterium]|nr:hypothetical protein [Bryobacterales bacterium]